MYVYNKRTMMNFITLYNISQTLDMAVLFTIKLFYYEIKCH